MVFCSVMFFGNPRNPTLGVATSSQAYIGEPCWGLNPRSRLESSHLQKKKLISTLPSHADGVSGLCFTR